MDCMPIIQEEALTTNIHRYCSCCTWSVSFNKLFVVRCFIRWGLCRTVVRELWICLAKCYLQMQVCILSRVINFRICCKEHLYLWMMYVGVCWFLNDYVKFVCWKLHCQEMWQKKFDHELEVSLRRILVLRCVSGFFQVLVVETLASS